MWKYIDILILLRIVFCGVWWKCLFPTYIWYSDSLLFTSLISHMSPDMLSVCDLSFLSEEEAQQVQEKMDALRIRCSVLSLSSLDVLQRLEQALEASSRCTSSQEDLHLWLGRIERELLGAVGAQTHAGDAVLCAAERQRVMFPHNPNHTLAYLWHHSSFYLPSFYNPEWY